MASTVRSQKSTRRAQAAAGAGAAELPNTRRLGSRIRWRMRKRQQADFLQRHPVGFEHFPAFDGLKPVLMFLMFPAGLAAAIVVTGGNWPSAVLYSFALLMGIYVAYSTLYSLELVVACLLLYLPFTTTHSIGIAPGINGTNMLLMLGLGGVLVQFYQGRGLFKPLPGTLLVYVFALLSAMSGITTLSLPNGYSYLVYDQLLNYKGWLEQFVFLFILQCAIRDRETAKRIVVYMGLTSIVLALYVVPEMLDKLGRSTIEKSRLGGPHQQSNNFGGFVAYTLMPVVALFIIYIRNLRAWLITPYLLLALKILVSTFSRGAYLAIAIGAFSAGYFRGKGFLVFWASMGVVFLMLFPQVIPESIMTRMQTVVDYSSNHNTTVRDEQLDSSSRDRLILWRAAAKIAMENPLTGLGFKSFPVVRNDYTEQQMLHVSDPHSMYLTFAAEMGLPVLALFLIILGFAYYMGYFLSRTREDHFIRAVGIGGAAATICYAIICIFGSRAVNLEFSAHFWALFVVMQVLRTDPEARTAWQRKAAKRHFPLDELTNNRALQVTEQADSEGQSGSGRRSARSSANPSPNPFPRPSTSQAGNRSGNRNGAVAHRQSAAKSRRGSKQRQVRPRRTNAFTELKKNRHPDSG